MNEYGNLYNGNSFDDFETIIPILIFYGVVLLFILGLGLVNYILRGLAIYKMSKARGLENGWLGFIPVAHKYQFGKIAGEIEFGNKKIENAGIWLIILPIIYSTVFFIGYIIALIPFIFSMMSLGNDPSSEEVMGPIIGLMIAIFIFMLVIIVGQVFLYLFKYLALHKIFSHYNSGQKPVFYLIIAIFIPLAESILMYKQSKQPFLPKPAENL